MVQWGTPIFFSLGVHFDPRRMYLDLHLVFFIITIGDPRAYDEYEAWWSSRERK